MENLKKAFNSTFNYQNGVLSVSLSIKKFMQLMEAVVVTPINEELIEAIQEDEDFGFIYLSLVLKPEKVLESTLKSLINELGLDETIYKDTIELLQHQRQRIGNFLHTLVDTGREEKAIPLIAMATLVDSIEYFEQTHNFQFSLN